VYIVKDKPALSSERGFWLTLKTTIVKTFHCLCINNWYKYKNMKLKALIRHNIVHYTMSCNHIFTHNHIFATYHVQINQNTWHISYQTNLLVWHDRPMLYSGFQNLIYRCLVRLLEWGTRQSQGLHTIIHAQKKIHTSMPQVGFKLMIPLFD
jgi:hypothetical protein